MYNEALSENLAVVATLDPVSQGAATVTSDEIDMKLHRRVLFILMTGLIAATGTLDCKIQAATTSGGTFVDLTGKAITQLTDADDNKQVLIEVTAEEVAAQGLRYVRASVTAATAASLMALVALAGFSRYGDPESNDLSTVDEIIR
jgi:hypothetical protein